MIIQFYYRCTWVSIFGCFWLQKINRNNDRRSCIKYDWQPQNRWSVITQGNCQVLVLATDRLRLVHYGSDSYKNTPFCLHFASSALCCMGRYLIMLVVVIRHSVLAHWAESTRFVPINLWHLKTSENRGPGWKNIRTVLWRKWLAFWKCEELNEGNCSQSIREI